MPTFTTIAWETLFETRPRASYQNLLNSNQQQQQQQFPKSYAVDDENHAKKKKEMERVQTPNHIFITPALYVTPQPTPIPDSSSDPHSPSPYVVNHKRRRGDALTRPFTGFHETPPPQESRDSDSDCEEVTDDVFLGAEIDRNGGSVAGDGDGDDDDDFFSHCCDSVSVASSNGVTDFGKRAESRSYVSNQGEFFDADEVLSSDGSVSNSSSYGPRIESELRATRLSLLEEIERRKTAEYAVAKMYSQWQRLGNLLSQTGLTFPTSPNATSMQFEIDSLEQFCQELVVSRFVAESIGRGEARAEAEIAAEAIYELKDQEISRLRDRLQYYEAANHEMSQRNQEVMEVARRQRQRRKSHQRWWIWGCIGMSVTIGASVIAYSYLPQMGKPHMLPSSSDSSDASCITSTGSANS
ncbi:hypothetical protein CsSME_00025180 [Camellia sinensis var. sinensis]